MRRLGQAVEIVEAWRTLPQVEIRLWGGVAERAVFDSFVRRHPLCPLVGRKELGAALLRLPDGLGPFMEGRARRQFRARARRAQDEGFAFGPIDPVAELASIRAVNVSAEVRQGSPLPQVYRDRSMLERWAAQPGRYFGVRPSSGPLAAYLYGRHVGEVFIVDTLLGHVDALPKGVMYLLVREVIAALIALPPRERPTWVMYDTWFGASEGLRTFKQQLGFEPHRVRWRWSG